MTSQWGLECIKYANPQNKKTSGEWSRIKSYRYTKIARVGEPVEFEWEVETKWVDIYMDLSWYYKCGAGPVTILECPLTFIVDKTYGPPILIGSGIMFYGKHARYVVKPHKHGLYVFVIGATRMYKWDTYVTAPVLVLP